MSFARLKVKGVFCSHTRSVAAAGRVNCLCFDKTGTLTEDGLTLTGVQVVVEEEGNKGGALGPAMEDPAHLYIRHVQQQQQQQQQQVQPSNSNSDPKAEAKAEYAPAALVSLVMAACHSVSLLEEDDDALNRSTASLAVSAAKSVFEGMHGPTLGKVLPLVRSLSVSSGSASVSGLDGDGSEYGGQGHGHGREGIALVRTSSAQAAAAAHQRGLHMQRSLSLGGAGASPARNRNRPLNGLSWGRADSNASATRTVVPIFGPTRSAPGGTTMTMGGSSSISGGSSAGPQPGGATVTGANNNGTSSMPVISISSGGSGNGSGNSGDRRASFHASPAAAFAGSAAAAAAADAAAAAGGPAPHQLVGDSLEVQLFLSSGWRFCTRPDDDIPDSVRAGEGRRRRHLRAPPDAVGASVFDEVGVWAHPDLPPGTDTVMLPPAALVGNAGAVALAVVRRLDFDADLRRMGVIVQVLVAGRTTASTDGSTEGGGGTSNGGGRGKGPLLLLVKGAPEAMRELCLPASLPLNLPTELHRLTCSGLRVLGCAWRHVDPGEVGSGRAELEQRLRFLGLMTMENRLKAETVPFLSIFRAAAFRIIMITGDNPATAAAVGRMAGAFCTPKPDAPTLVLDGDGSAEAPLRVADMSAAASPGPGSGPGSGAALSLSLHDYLAAFFPDSAGALRLPASAGYSSFSSASASDSALAAQNQAVAALRGPHDLVVTGRAFGALHRAHEEALESPDGHGHGHAHVHVGWTALEVVIGKASIFARMSPQHKQDLVRALQDTGLVVCMTGDGANDSGALKAGDIGISIAAKAAAPAPAEGEEEGEEGEAGEEQQQQEEVRGVAWRACGFVDGWLEDGWLGRVSQPARQREGLEAD